MAARARLIMNLNHLHTNGVLLSQRKAKQLADDGMAQVLENERSEWREAFLRFAEKYAKQNAFFKIEFIRFEWLSTGGEDPHHPNVYGAISKQMVMRGYCEFFSYAKAASMKTRNHPVVVYKSLIFEVKK
jgi:hypothetical protein